MTIRLSCFRVHLIAVTLLAFFATPARAIVVEDLYTALVEVPDRNSASLNAAARAGLSEVVVRVSGTQSVLEVAPIAAMLRDARRYLQQFTYRESRPGGTLAAELQFDEAAVRPILIESGAPLWTASRPPVLVWLVTEGPTGREFVSRASHPELSAELERAFRRRGVPLRLPLYDLQDTQALAPGTVWRFSRAEIGAASGRYGVEDILAGRVLQLSGGDWLGDWSYLNVAAGGRERSVTAATAADFTGVGAALVAEALAGRYAVASNSGSVDAAARIEVRGINSFGEYAAVMAWLEGLELVDGVNPERVEGDRLFLRIDARTGLEQLRPVIELDTRLSPVPDSALVYQWQP